MPNVTFSGDSKLIIVNSGVTYLNVKEDIYSDWKEWMTNTGDFSGDTNDNSLYLQALVAVGGDQISPNFFLGTTYFLENGWKIRPYEGNHTLVVEGNLYSRDGSSPFVNTIGSYNVLINQKTSNLVDTVSLGSITNNTIAETVWTVSKNASYISGDTMGKTVVNTENTASDNQALILSK